MKLEDENSVLSRVDPGDTLRMGPSAGRVLIPRCPHLLSPGSVRGGKPRHWGATGWIRGHTRGHSLCSVCGHQTWAQSIRTSYPPPGILWPLREKRVKLAASPALLSNLPFALPGSSGNTVAVPDGTPKISQLRGPTDSHLSSPTSHSGEQRGAATSFFSHPKEINMLCKNNSNQQSSTLHLPPSGPSLLAFR